MRSLFLLFIGLFFSVSLAAQNGTVRGTVSDAETGEALMFANVLVVGSDPVIGESTDLDGNYTLKLAPGTYDLEFSYTGFPNKVITGIIVTADEVTVMDALMDSEAVDLGIEVVVEAARIDRSENAVLVLQKKAIGIQDGISAQEISRYGSGNAAESLKRVTGASVVGGKYIYVRGLGDRYSSAQLNGLALPSTDPYRNSTQLDVIPSNLLDNIIAAKTFTPNLPGNFTGGNVDIRTKSFPEAFTMSVSLSGSINSLSSFNDEFLTYEGGKNDKWGYDDGNRDAPSQLENEDLRDLLLRSRSSIRNMVYDDPALGTLFDGAMKGLNQQFTPTTETSGFNNGISFSVGNQYTVGNNPFGLLLGVNFSRGFDHYGTSKLNFYDLSSGGGVASLNPYYEFDEAASTESANLSGLLGLSYKIGGSNKLSFNALHNHTGDKTARYLAGNFPGKVSTDGTYESRFVYWNERAFNSLQLSGEHVFGQSGVEFNWSGGYVNSTQDEPDTRVFENTFRVRDTEPFDTIYGIDPGEFQLPFHFYRDLEDKQRIGKADLSIPFAQAKSKANKIQLGFLASTKDREFNTVLWQFKDDGAGASSYAGTDASFFGNDNIGIVGVDEERERAILGLYVRNDERSNKKNSYTGTEEITAFYGMATYDLGRLRVIGGARVEATKITVESVDTTFNVGSIDTTDILPSLNLIYNLDEEGDMKLRASYSQTLARPNMRELAPFSSFDRGTDIRVTGNTELTRTTINNYDLRWEYYPKPGELIAVSGYYKNFNNPIIKAFDLASANPEIQYVNVDEATVYGVEFEFRKKLGFITPALENLRFISNISFIESEVALTEEECQNVKEFNPDKGCVRPFQGQSPFLLNAGLNYVKPEAGLDVILSLNVFGERLTLNNKGADPDFYQQPMPQLDFSVKKKIGSRYGVQLFARNLLNANYKETIEFAGEERTIREYERGVTYGLKLSYNIDRARE